MTPLNAVAPSASRLGLPVLQTPASVEIVTQQTMQDQGYRTTTEIAKGAVGVLDIDFGGRASQFFDAGLHLRRGERSLQRNFDRGRKRHHAL